MSWQKGVFWYAGVISFSIGYGLVHTPEEGAIILGFLLMFTAATFKWDNN